MGNIGGTELLLIIFVIVIFFGAKKLPEIAQGLGKGIREFRKASRDVDDAPEPPRQRLEPPTTDTERKG
jgi:sec-independent protein translocase protein TatA